MSEVTKAAVALALGHPSYSTSLKIFPGLILTAHTATLFSTEILFQQPRTGQDGAKALGIN